MHPAVIDAYLEGNTVLTLEQRAEQELQEHLADLAPEEAAVLTLLQQRLRGAAAR